MEHSAEDSHGHDTGNRTRSLDLQTLYDHEKRLPTDQKKSQKNPLKRKHVMVEDIIPARKKSKKDVMLSSLASVRKGKKNSHEVSKGTSSSFSDSNQIRSGRGPKADNGNNCDGTASNTGGDAIRFRKPRRDSGQRKKVDPNRGVQLKLEGTSNGDVSSGNVAVMAQTKDGLNGHLTHDANVSLDEKRNGHPDMNGNNAAYSCEHEDNKLKGKKNLNDNKGSRSSVLNSVQEIEKGDGMLPLEKGESSSKKVKRNLKSKKGTDLVILDGAKEDNLVLHKSVRSDKVSTADDEENLEENAARMLSSLFIHSHTHFSPRRNSDKSPTSCQDVASSGCNAQSGSDTDANDRVLRPRGQHGQKGTVRKRRHFYEVFAKNLDPYWMLQRKTKIYWPLDQIWYYGKILGYDPDNNLHHIRYDDQEEEWIDLCNEKVKLLLFPSELPYGCGRRRSVREDKHAVKRKPNVASQDGHQNKESEPIISWLGKSTHRTKSPPSGSRKKQKMSNNSDEGLSSSSSLTKNDNPKSLDIETSQKGMVECFRDSTLQGTSTTVLDGCGPSAPERSCKPPIVYVRRRFRSKTQGVGEEADCRFCLSPEENPRLVGSLCCHFDLSDPKLWSSSANGFCHDGPSGSTDDLLVLSLPIVKKAVRYELACPIPLVPYYSFGLENLSLFHAAQMLLHGTLISLWPNIHLKMLFVDSSYGLSFLLFEGCLKKAIFFLFLILNVFHEPLQEQKLVDDQLPRTSICFQLSLLGNFRKRVVCALCNFSDVGIYKWNYVVRRLKKECLLVRQLPPSECTYENIRALEYGFGPFPMVSVLQDPSSLLGFDRKTKHWISGDSVLWTDANDMSVSRPSIAGEASFTDLHLKLLLKQNVSHARDKYRDSDSFHLHSETNNIVKRVDSSLGETASSRSLNVHRSSLGQISKDTSVVEQFSCSGFEARNDDTFIGFRTPISQCLADEVCFRRRMRTVAEAEQCGSSSETLYPEGRLSPVESKTNYGPADEVTVEIPPFESAGNIKGRQNGTKSSSIVCDALDTPSRSPNPSDLGGMWHQSRVENAFSLLGNLSPLSDGRTDLIASGPKKPRTQVSYSMPIEGHEHASRLRTPNTGGFSHKRIRRASEKKVVQSDVSKTSQRNMELFCDVNVLVIVSDRGWREVGAKVVLELLNHGEWRLAVKVSGSTKYSYKAHQFLQAGSTNRYTHAMMWKGGKDWILEFVDRSQWALFKEMHEECYNRNLRVASVKNIPIPGVRLIEESDNGVEVQFARPLYKYFRQTQNDVDFAMDPSNVLYDMDSDDERWVAKIRSRDVEEGGFIDLSDEKFEKIMDMLEKLAYARRQDNFSCNDLEDSAVGDESAEEIKHVYEYWREKREKKGMPLIRHLQPPLWQKYQQQVKEWELATGGHHKGATCVEKPPMYAFCMKPRGLEVLNRGSKHRSHKKLSISGHHNIGLGDSEGYPCFGGRRFYGYAFGEEKIHHAGYPHHGSSDSSPLLQPSTKMISPREVGSLGYFSLHSDAYERNFPHPQIPTVKSKRIGSFLSPVDQQQVFPSHFPNIMGRRSGWNSELQPEWVSQRYCHHTDGPRKIDFEQLDTSELDDYQLKEAISAAQHTVNISKMKRERALRLLYKADLAIHKAVVALMTAEATKAAAGGASSSSSSSSSTSSMEGSNSNACSEGQRLLCLPPGFSPTDKP